MACLDTKGILLLLQRLTFNMTRYAPYLDTLLETIEYVLEEVDLMEEWMRGRLNVGEGSTLAPPSVTKSARSMPS